MILITTAGKVGTEAARLIAERGAAVGLLVRSPERAVALTSIGVAEPIADMNAGAVGLVAEGDVSWITDAVPTIVGRPTRSFEQFASDHAAAFSQKTRWNFGSDCRPNWTGLKDREAVIATE